MQMIDFQSPTWRVLIVLNRVVGAIGLALTIVVGFCLYLLWDAT